VIEPTSAHLVNAICDFIQQARAASFARNCYRKLTWRFFAHRYCDFPVIFHIFAIVWQALNAVPTDWSYKFPCKEKQSSCNRYSSEHTTENLSQSLEKRKPTLYLKISRVKQQSSKECLKLSITTLYSQSIDVMATSYLFYAISDRPSCSHIYLMTLTLVGLLLRVGIPVYLVA